MGAPLDSSETPSQRYLTALAGQLAADGCEPRWEQWRGGRVLVGRRADFRIQWVATRLHLFTIAAVAPELSVPAIQDFTRSAQQYAKEHKGGLPPGLQTGIALFPCLISEWVDPAALAWAEATSIVEFAVMTRPVAVDAASGIVGGFRRTPFVGWIYSSYLRSKMTLYFDSAVHALDRRGQ